MGPGVVRPRWRVAVGGVVEGWGEDRLRALRGALHVQDGVALRAALRLDPCVRCCNWPAMVWPGPRRRACRGLRRWRPCFSACSRSAASGVMRSRRTVARGHGGRGDPLLRLLAVDLEMLAMLLGGDPAESGGRIDLSTGECRPAYADEPGAGPEGEEDDDPERWLYVPALGSRAGYRDMELFIEEVGDAALADRLRIARPDPGLAGRGGLLPAHHLLRRAQLEFVSFGAGMTHCCPCPE